MALMLNYYLNTLEERTAQSEHKPILHVSQ